MFGFPHESCGASLKPQNFLPEVAYKACAFLLIFSCHYRSYFIRLCFFCSSTCSGPLIHTGKGEQQRQRQGSQLKSACPPKQGGFRDVWSTLLPHPPASPPARPASFTVYFHSPKPSRLTPSDLSSLIRNRQEAEQF